MTSSRRELRPGHGTSARIADHRGEIADDQNGLMSEILKLPKFPKDQSVTEMKIRDWWDRRLI